MSTRLFLLALCLAGCARTTRDVAGAAGADSASHAATRAIPAVAFRVPHAGGPLAVYALPALEATPWGAGSRLTGARSAIGVDIVGRRLLFRDNEGAVASFDLVSLRQKIIAPRNALATMAADGTVMSVDASGDVTESHPWGVDSLKSFSLGEGVRQVFAAPGARLIAIRPGQGEDTLQVAGKDAGITVTQALPSSEDRTASRDGDAVALATDSGLVVFEERDMEHPWYVHIAGKPRAVAFSPSGHRLYVALTEKSELAVVDRFSHRERAAISLPGQAARIRPDPWGRVLLVRGESDGDNATWVISIASNSVSGTLKGGWASDLPTVSENGVLLVREGGSVIARDLRSLDSLGAVSSGARDLWFAGRWVPSSATAAVRAETRPATAVSAAPAASAPRTDTRPGPTPGRPGASPGAPPAEAVAPAPVAPAAFYAQLLATHSEEAARTLASQLAGRRVIVVPPTPGTGDDNWRVMSGPFRSREAADSAGREIGIAYWIVDKSRETRP
ncbi:MAG: SPOR domain-containing protein [Gemmatimonadales bacterium]